MTPRKVYGQSEIKLLIQNTFFSFSEIQIRKYAESIFSYIAVEIHQQKQKNSQYACIDACIGIEGFLADNNQTPTWHFCKVP